jgi:hypothetical protein
VSIKERARDGFLGLPVKKESAVLVKPRDDDGSGRFLHAA